MVRISFLTCVFLVGLRLVIGWHFFFEGVNKYQSTLNEGAENYKPFSSAGYFAEAEGPLGPIMRDFIGDADAIALSKLKLAESSDDNPASRMPKTLAVEWDAYARQFGDFYHLSDADKAVVEKSLNKAKADYALWLTDKLPPDPKKDLQDDYARWLAEKLPPDPKKDAEDDPRKNWIKASTVGYPGLIYRPEADVQQRILAYQMFIEKLREDYEKVLRTMKKDVELTRLRTLKTMTGDIRKNLMKEVDERTAKMKESLAKVVGVRTAGVDLTAETPKINDRVLAMVTVAGRGTDAGLERMPPALGKQWDEYVEFLKTNKQDKNLNSPDRIDEMLRDAKIRYVRFLLDRDPYTGTANAKVSATAVEDFKKSLAEYDDLVAKSKTPLTDQEKADNAKLVETALENVATRLQAEKSDVPFDDAEYQKAVAKLNLAVKRNQDAGNLKSAEAKAIEQAAYEKALSLLRAADVAARLELFKLTLDRLQQAEKAKEQTPSEANKSAAAAATKLVAVPRNDFVDEIKLHTDILRYNLGGFNAEGVADPYKGTLEPEKPTSKLFGISFPATRLTWLDAVTRWTLLIAGGCLLVGLFTRLACLTCIVFLINELLSNPALPWLPTSPKTEGNYTFINKNTIELFALLVLLTLPTGRWLGLDAWLSCLWPFGRRKK